MIELRISGTGTGILGSVGVYASRPEGKNHFQVKLKHQSLHTNSVLQNSIRIQN